MGKRPKLALVTRGCRPEGGVHRYAYELALRLRGDYDVTVIAIKSSLTDEHDVRFIPVKVPTFWDHLIPHLWAFPRLAARALQDQGFDLVHVQGGEGCPGDIMTVHMCYKAWLKRVSKLYPGRGLEYWGKALNPLVHIHAAHEKHQMRSNRLAAAIAVSEGTESDLKENYSLPGELTEVIPNGIDLARFAPGKDDSGRAGLRSELNAGEDDLVVIFVGVAMEHKGLRVMLEALSKLPDSRLRLLVLGNWRAKEEFGGLAGKLGISDRVIFGGVVPDMERYYGAADIFCMPSIFENFSFALLEAAACGLPLVTTRVFGATEFIRDKENGFFVERDAGSIANVLDMLARDAALRRRAGREARRTAEGYSWDAVVEKTRGVYERVLRRKRGRR
jgi:UDP-glucose:(heptosyl)LPS alpha-1,3-glucosyltransferase